jgi:hypothetical protein
VFPPPCCLHLLSKKQICLVQFFGLEFLFVVLEDLSIPEKLSKEVSKMVCFLLFAKAIRG